MLPKYTTQNGQESYLCLQIEKKDNFFSGITQKGMTYEL